MAEVAAPLVTTGSDRRQSLKALVTSFGSERQKRAVTAAERNRVDPTSLDAVLTTAVSHARVQAEKAAEGKEGGAMGRARGVCNKNHLCICLYLKSHRHKKVPC